MRLVGMAVGGDGGGWGNLRVAKTPPLQSGVCGEGVASHAANHHLRPCGHQRERRGITTRHAIRDAARHVATN